jgi:hypothetical protein
MARIKRKKMEIDENTFKGLMQETYNDAHQIRSTIIALFNNWNAKIKEQGEIAATGKEVVALINALARNQDQKLTLMKVLSDILYTKNKLNSGSDQTKAPVGENELTEDAKSNILKMIEQAREKGEIDV